MFDVHITTREKFDCLRFLKFEGFFKPFTSFTHPVMSNIKIKRQNHILFRPYSRRMKEGDLMIGTGVGK